MSIDRTITGIVAFAGGIFAGFMLAPQSGAETRAKLSEEGRAQLNRIEERLTRLEKKLAALGGQVVAAGHGVGDKVKNSTVGQMLPDLPDDPEAFKVDDQDVAGDLRHMPRK